MRPFAAVRAPQRPRVAVIGGVRRQTAVTVTAGRKGRFQYDHINVVGILFHAVQTLVADIVDLV